MTSQVINFRTASANGAKPRGRPRKTLADRDDGNRRQDLIAAAAKLFHNQGFAATSTRDIAAAVGMRSGSPFYYFSTKEALLAQVMEQGMRSAISRQTELMQQCATALVAPAASAMAGHVVAELAVLQSRNMLKTLVRGHFEVLLGEGNDFIPVMLYEWRSLSAEQQAHIAQLQMHYESAWMPTLAALHGAGALRGDLKLARLLMFGALNWTAQWFNAGGVASLDDLTQAALDVFLHDGASPISQLKAPA